MNRHDQAAFFARLGFTGNEPLVERRETWDETRPSSTGAVPSTALPTVHTEPFTELRARLEALEQRCRELDEMASVLLD
jgi:hypothetical protein